MKLKGMNSKKSNDSRTNRKDNSSYGGPVIEAMHALSFPHSALHLITFQVLIMSLFMLNTPVMVVAQLQLLDCAIML